MRGVLSAQYAIAPSRSIAALAACLVVAGTLVVRGVGRQHA